MDTRKSPFTGVSVPEGTPRTSCAYVRGDLCTHQGCYDEQARTLVNASMLEMTTSPLLRLLSAVSNTPPLGWTQAQYASARRAL